MKLNLILLIFGVLPVSLLCSLSEFIQNYGMASEESAAAAQPVEQAPTETGVKAESTATEPPLAPTDTTAPSVQVEAEPTITPTEAAPPTEAPSVAEQNSAPNVITWSGEDQPIAYGDTAQGTIAQIGDRHTYVFEGQEGEHVTASLKANRFKLYLMRPDERVWDCPTLNSDCLIDNVELPETGQYTLIVDGDGEHVGDYTVTLFQMENLSQPINYGETNEGTLSVIGDQRYYTFEGQEGEHVTASLKANRFKLYLMRPDERVWDCPTLNSDCLIDNVELPETGQYTLIVDGDGKHVGDYTVTLVKNSH